MSVGPWDFSGEAIGRLGYSADLEPSEDNVKFWRAADETELASNLLGAPKASEEQEQIAAAYPVAGEMTLRGTSLPENRTPSRGARNRIAAQIRIEMRAVALADAAARQVFDKLSD